MWHIGIDLHRKTLTIAAVHDSGEVRPATKLECSDTDQIREAFEELRPFRAVIEATGTYRWLNDLLAPLGTVLLAHPMRLRAMILRRSKSDRLDAQMLAQLLQMNQIPLAYIPSERIQFIRDATRYRTTLSRQVAQAKGLLRQLLARQNMQAPYRYPFGPRGRYWFSRQDFGAIGNRMRDDLLERLEWGMRKVSEMDAQLEQIAEQYPEIEAIQDLHGVGRFTALSIVAEFGDVTRFREGRQAAAYTGLTPRVYQSGESSRGGHISKLGSPWLRWILVEAAMKLVRRDVALANFYNRIRKRSGAKKARVAAGRKLAEICWKRLYRWHRQHEVQAA